MNNTFNLSRFAQLFMRHTREQFKTYLMSFIVLMGLVGVLLGYIFYTNNNSVNPTANVIYFLICLFLGCTIFTSTIFSELNDKRKAIPYLMLPASAFEKYLLAWLYSLVIFSVLYVSGFYAIDRILVSMSEIKPTTATLSASPGKGQVFYDALVLGLLLLHSLAFFGAIFFRKLHFIKTGFVLIIFIALIGLLNKPFLEAFIGIDIASGQAFSSVLFEEGNKLYKLTSNVVADSSRYMLGGLIFLFWLASYFKLKEQEV